jgi:pilus assembly protein CpaE
VSLALQSNGKLASGDVVGDLVELAAKLLAERAPAVIVDLDAQPDRLLSQIEPLVRRFSDTRFLVVSDTVSHQLLLEAMQVGARHVLLKSSIPAELTGVLSRICPPSNHGRQGSVVTVLSAGGGCGATTVAVNLAEEIQRLDPKKASEPSLVMDLDPHYGGVATYYGLDGEYGLFDVLARPGSIDAQLIQSSAMIRSPQVHVLLGNAQARLGERTALEPQRLAEAIEACRNGYRWTLIDAPRVSLDVAAELTRHSVATLLLMQLTVKDIRVVRQMLNGLAERGIPRDGVRLLVNRYRRRGLLITVDEARRALNLTEAEVPGVLSNDYGAVCKAMNLGKPLSEVSPRSDFTRDLRKLAEALVKSASPVPAASQ